MEKKIWLLLFKRKWHWKKCGIYCHCSQFGFECKWHTVYCSTPIHYLLPSAAQLTESFVLPSNELNSEMQTTETVFEHASLWLTRVKIRYARHAYLNHLSWKSVFASTGDFWHGTSYVCFTSHLRRLPTWATCSTCAPLVGDSFIRQTAHNAFVDDLFQFNRWKMRRKMQKMPAKHYTCRTESIAVNRCGWKL